MAYYYVNERTQELNGPVELPVIPGMGVVLPGNAIELPEVLPPAESGHVWVWRDGAALQLIDLRNRPVYRKDNGNFFYWNELGPLPEYLTLKPRPSEFYVWGTDDWVLDVAAERAGKVAEADVERDNRLREVVIRVAPLQYAYELGEASNEQLTALQAWKRYTVKLAQIELQTDYPLTIDWPVAPAKVVVSPAA
ncbi:MULTISPECIES: tail fiber assembly protein [unclassified Pseudomonas]|uniref:tail fiber assembly protein n=1 Tax=unclassified Pseudomonas TaxID=196821 RepID=UPI000A1FD484|nr:MULTISPECIES: tail fiber assembly protein [unclassified Pseudomonas]MDI2141743.1 tail fiber assembly protein [Pseudomonas sp. ITA]